MLGRGHSPRADRRTVTGATLPLLERIAPAPSIPDLVAQIEARTKPGDIVLDLNGRGGWIARAALGTQRSAADLETLSLTRLVADVVVRPPDPVHLDEALSAIAARPLGDTTLRRAIDGLFASTCPICEKPVVLDAVHWERAGADPSQAQAPETGPFAPGSEKPVRRDFRCEQCQSETGGEPARHAELASEDVVRADFEALPSTVRDSLRKRFPTRDREGRLPDRLLALHTPRQLLALHAILEAIEMETRPAPVTAALRLAFLSAVDRAGRLGAGLSVEQGPPPALELTPGVEVPEAQSWREVNPWLAFEQGVEEVRDFIEGLGADGLRPAAMRPLTELMELHDSVSNLLLAEATHGSLRRLAMAGERIAQSRPAAKVRLVLGQAPLPMSRETLARVYRYSGWALGSGAASMLPLDDLFGGARRRAQGQAADDMARSVARSLALATPALAWNGHAVVLLDDADPRSLVAAALGGAAAGHRLIEARLRRLEGESPLAVFVPPTGVMDPGPRTRANRPLPPISGGAGDPGTISGQGVFTAPEGLREGPFRPSIAATAVRETAIEVLKARGEPTGFEQLIGDVLIGLDRSGQLARLACRYRPPDADAGWDAWLEAAPHAEAEPCEDDSDEATPRGHAAKEPAGPVDELLAVIRGELDRASNRHIRQIEPGVYWLTSDEDRAATAQPLADRVEWAVFSLLSSSPRISQAAVFERTAALFAGRDAPDGDLVRACLDSYTAPGSAPESIVTADRLERRTAEHDAMIAAIADLGHRLGAHVWIGRRQQQRRVGGRRLAEWLEQEEIDTSPAMIAWGPEEELERVDCAWYAPHRAAYLFEVEWTAMLGDAVLTRHGRFPDDNRVVRFLAVPPERAALVRHKLDRSPLLRKAFADRNWHVLKWDRLIEFGDRDQVSMAALEPYLGIDAEPQPAPEPATAAHAAVTSSDQPPDQSPAARPDTSETPPAEG
jgi:hypothetical protein